MIELDPFTVQMIISAFIPIVLGFVMKTSWSSQLKSNVSIVAAAAITLITNAVNDAGVAFISWDMLQLFVVGLAIQLATYNGFYKQAIEINRVLPSVVPGHDDGGEG